MSVLDPKVGFSAKPGFALLFLSGDKKKTGGGGKNRR